MAERREPEGKGRERESTARWHLRALRYPSALTPSVRSIGADAVCSQRREPEASASVSRAGPRLRRLKRVPQRVEVEGMDLHALSEESRTRKGGSESESEGRGLQRVEELELDARVLSGGARREGWVKNGAASASSEREGRVQLRVEGMDPSAVERVEPEGKGWAVLTPAIRSDGSWKGRASQGRAVCVE
ncbi:hypothetical protein DFH09DRAFT_1318040 [Mycena vulgaris]|nr:hypothetical protein DFH09DRAFT_1318011 [Mycena vulgaris]KAJ6555631.1 hypothetical protein DFH09DRAFT_1318040 [Mycena vulgaris]